MHLFLYMLLNNIHTSWILIFELVYSYVNVEPASENSNLCKTANFVFLTSYCPSSQKWGYYLKKKKNILFNAISLKWKLSANPQCYRLLYTLVGLSTHIHTPLLIYCLPLPLFSLLYTCSLSA